MCQSSCMVKLACSNELSWCIAFATSYLAPWCKKGHGPFVPPGVRLPSEGMISVQMLPTVGSFSKCCDEGDSKSMMSTTPSLPVCHAELLTGSLLPLCLPLACCAISQGGGVSLTAAMPASDTYSIGPPHRSHSRHSCVGQSSHGCLNE